VSHVERFADALELHDDALRQLLGGGGDAPERVWAAWALALRYPDAAGMLFERAAGREPSDGARAHFAVVLVGHQEFAAATTLALHDPSPLVRSAAVRCLARAAGADDEAANATLLAVLEDPSPDVRGAVLDGLRADAPPSVRRAVEAHAGDPVLEVRSAAVEYLLRTVGVTGALRERAGLEPNPALFETLVRAWARAEGEGAVVRASSAWPTPAVERLLRLEVHRGVAASELEHLLARGSCEIDAHLARLEAPIRWSLTLLVRMARLPVEPWDGEYERRWPGAAGSNERLLWALPGITPAELGPEEMALTKELLQCVERNAREAYPQGTPTELAEVWNDPARDMEEEGIPWVCGIELLAELQRLVGGVAGTTGGTA
jgi:hypothetical protein